MEKIKEAIDEGEKAKLFEQYMNIQSLEHHRPPESICKAYNRRVSEIIGPACRWIDSSDDEETDELSLDCHKKVETSPKKDAK